MVKKCIVCGRNIRSGRKYCYEHRNYSNVKSNKNSGEGLGDFLSSKEGEFFTIALLTFASYIGIFYFFKEGIFELGFLSIIFAIMFSLLTYIFWKSLKNSKKKKEFKRYKDVKIRKQSPKKKSSYQRIPKNRNIIDVSPNVSAEEYWFGK